MNDNTEKIHDFYAVKARQRDFSFYLTTIKAKDLQSLCEGLKSPDSREQPIGSNPTQITEDAKEFVDALAASTFASEISKIETDNYGDDNPYQRFIDEARVKSIAAYLQEEFALIPNGVVLVAAEHVALKIRDKKHFAIVKLMWKGDLPLQIIDGQHRVEGLKSLMATAKEEFAEFELPVCLLVDLPFYLQAELFAVINGKQKTVPRSRIYDLLGYRPIQDKVLREKAYKGELAVHRFCHLAIRVLNTSSKSPLYQKIKMRGAGQGVVTQAAMVDHMANLVVPRRNSPRLSTFPVLNKYFRQGDLIGISKVCIFYFMGIAKAWPAQWKTTETLSSSLFGKTSGVAIMFMVLHDLALLEVGPEMLTMEKSEAYWRKAPGAKIMTPPAGGSRGFQLEWYRSIMASMVGPDYEAKLHAAAEKYRPKLTAEGAFYSKKV